MSIFIQNEQVKEILYNNNVVKKVFLRRYQNGVPNDQVAWCQPIQIAWTNSNTTMKATHAAGGEPTITPGQRTLTSGDYIYFLEQLNVTVSTTANSSYRSTCTHYTLSKFLNSSVVEEITTPTSMNPSGILNLDININDLTRYNKINFDIDLYHWACNTTSTRVYSSSDTAFYVDYGEKNVSIGTLTFEFWNTSSHWTGRSVETFYNAVPIPKDGEDHIIYNHDVTFYVGGTLTATYVVYVKCQVSSDGHHYYKIWCPSQSNTFRCYLTEYLVEN